MLLRVLLTLLVFSFSLSSLAKIEIKALSVKEFKELPLNFQAEYFQEMSRAVKDFEVTWKRRFNTKFVQVDPWIKKILKKAHAGGWKTDMCAIGGHIVRTIKNDENGSIKNTGLCPTKLKQMKCSGMTEKRFFQCGSAFGNVCTATDRSRISEDCYNTFIKEFDKRVQDRDTAWISKYYTKFHQYMEKTKELCNKKDTKERAKKGSICLLLARNTSSLTRAYQEVTKGFVNSMSDDFKAQQTILENKKKLSELGKGYQNIKQQHKKERENKKNRTHANETYSAQKELVNRNKLVINCNTEKISSRAKHCYENLKKPIKESLLHTSRGSGQCSKKTLKCYHNLKRTCSFTSLNECYKDDLSDSPQSDNNYDPVSSLCTTAKQNKSKVKSYLRELRTKEYSCKALQGKLEKYGCQGDVIAKCPRVKKNQITCEINMQNCRLTTTSKCSKDEKQIFLYGRNFCIKKSNKKAPPTNKIPPAAPPRLENGKTIAI